MRKPRLTREQEAARLTQSRAKRAATLVDTTRAEFDRLHDEGDHPVETGWELRKAPWRLVKPPGE